MDNKTIFLVIENENLKFQSVKAFTRENNAKCYMKLLKRKTGIRNCMYNYDFKVQQIQINEGDCKQEIEKEINEEMRKKQRSNEIYKVHMISENMKVYVRIMKKQQTDHGLINIDKSIENNNIIEHIDTIAEKLKSEARGNIILDENDEESDEESDNIFESCHIPLTRSEKKKRLKDIERIDSIAKTMMLQARGKAFLINYHLFSDDHNINIKFIDKIADELYKKANKLF